MFIVFGVDLVGQLQKATSAKHGEEIFQTAKKAVKKRFRQMALELHPDRGGDEEQLKEVTALWNILKGLQMRIQEPPPKPPLQVTSVFVGVSRSPGSPFGSSGTGATTDGFAARYGGFGIRGYPMKWAYIDEVL